VQAGAARRVCLWSVACRSASNSLRVLDQLALFETLVQEELPRRLAAAPLSSVRDWAGTLTVATELGATRISVMRHDEWVASSAAKQTTAAADENVFTLPQVRAWTSLPSDRFHFGRRAFHISSALTIEGRWRHREGGVCLNGAVWCDAAQAKLTQLLFGALPLSVLAADADVHVPAGDPLVVQVLEVLFSHSAPWRWQGDYM
jgi:hypothetical protein